jgi:hypothetical protein
LTRLDAMRKAISAHQAGKNPPPAAPKKPRTPAQRDRAHLERGRLPDGSQVEVYYSAENQEWRGSLSVPGNGPGQVDRCFTGSHSGLFTLLTELDTKYRVMLQSLSGENRVQEQPVQQVPDQAGGG